MVRSSSSRLTRPFTGSPAAAAAAACACQRENVKTHPACVVTVATPLKGSVKLVSANVFTPVSGCRSASIATAATPTSQLGFRLPTFTSKSGRPDACRV